MSVDALPARERILAAAIDVMRRKGVAAATTRAIAAEAGISEALIYRYFKNKLDVLRTSVREYVGSAFIGALSALPESVGVEPPAAAVERIALAALAYYHDLIPLLAALFSDNALIEWYRSSLRDQSAGPHRATLLLADYLAAEQRAGRLAAALECSAAAQMVLGACFQHVFFSMTVGAERLGVADADLARAVARNLAAIGAVRQEPGRAE
jgi:AcrR family transcriptional regulator